MKGQNELHKFICFLFLPACEPDFDLFSFRQLTHCPISRDYHCHGNIFRNYSKRKNDGISSNRKWFQLNPMQIHGCRFMVLGSGRLSVLFFDELATN